MLGREINTSDDLLYPPPPDGGTPWTWRPTVELKQALQAAHVTARGLLHTSKRDCDFQVYSRAYEEEDLVYQT